MNKVVEMFPEAKAKTFTISEYATGASEDVADAWGKPMEVYEQMVKQVNRYVPLVLNKAPNKPAAN